MGLLSPEAREVLSGGSIPLGFLAELSFRTGVERYWSGISPLSWDGLQWQGVGSLGSVSAMDSTEDFRANGITMGLCGLPREAFATLDALQANAYKGRAARFIVAIMDPTFTRVIHPIPRYFTIDTLDYEFDADTGLAITAGLEVETRRASRARVRRYTPQDQALDFPADKAFEFVPYITSGVDVKWGTGGAFFPASS